MPHNDLITDIPLRFLQPFHPPKDPQLLDALHHSMRQDGWKGRPLLAYLRVKDVQAITGSHRLAAAKQVGLASVPCLLIPPGQRVVNVRTEYLEDALAGCDNTPPLFHTLNTFEVDEEIIGLLTLDFMIRNEPDNATDKYDWRAVGRFAREKWLTDADDWKLPTLAELKQKGYYQ